MFSLCCRIFEFRKIIGDRELCKSLVPKDYPVFITKVREPVTALCGTILQHVTFRGGFKKCLLQTREDADCQIHDGFFTSPLEHFVPGILPPEAVHARYDWPALASRDFDALWRWASGSLCCLAHCVCVLLGSSLSFLRSGEETDQCVFTWPGLEIT